MAGRLDGKVALVTGAAGYLAKFHCTHLAREGATVIVTDIVGSTHTVEAVQAEGGEAVFHELDVTKPEDAERVVEATLKEYGRIDILLNNAALLGVSKPWMEFTVEDWDRQLRIDLTGMFVCARAVFPAMREQAYGKIINISSGTIWLGTLDLMPYNASKAGVIGFTRTLANEVGPYNINVNAIITGLFPGGEYDLPPGTIEGWLETAIEAQFLKREPDPNDLSRVIVFLASDDSQWITGQAIAVDGGRVRTGA